eukprot:1088142-Pleurochrysis_carterae.AAC.1
MGTHILSQVAGTTNVPILKHAYMRAGMQAHRRACKLPLGMHRFVQGQSALHASVWMQIERAQGHKQPRTRACQQVAVTAQALG